MYGLDMYAGGEYLGMGRAYAVSYQNTGFVGPSKYNATASPGYVKGSNLIDQNPVMVIIGKIQV